MQEYIIPVLLAVNVLISLGLLIFILLQKKKSDGDKAEIEILKEKLSSLSFDSKNVADQLQRNRQDMATSQKFMREEMSASMQKMTDELLKMRKDTYDYHLKMNEMISQSLGEHPRDRLSGQWVSASRHCDRL